MRLLSGLVELDFPHFRAGIQPPAVLFGRRAWEPRWHAMPTDRTPSGVIAGHPSPPPPVLAGWMSVFRGCFSAPVWSRVLVLVAGAVLAPGKRTVSQALRVMGLAARSGFSRYHEVLNRARCGTHTPDAGARRLSACGRGGARR